MPPIVTTRTPFDAYDQASAPVYAEHRDPFEPDQNWLELSEFPMIRSLVPLPLRQDHTLFPLT